MGSASRNKILVFCQEFDPQVDYTISLLKRFGVECIRWPTNTFPLKSSLAINFREGAYAGAAKIGERQFDFREIRSAWYRHPAPYAFPADLSVDDRRFVEREVREAFAGFMQIAQWFWVNHPDKARIAASKILQLKVAQSLGFEIPETLITNDSVEAELFFNKCDQQMVYKAFWPGFFIESGKVLCTSPVSRENLKDLALLKSTPGIFQRIVQKRLDLRITVIGRRVFATEIHSQGNPKSVNDWRAVPAEQLPHAQHKLPHRIETLCLRFLRRFGLVYGAIDMVLTPEGRYVFLENNPSGQFGWIEYQTGAPLTATLARLLVAGEMV